MRSSRLALGLLVSCLALAGIPACGGDDSEQDNDGGAGGATTGGATGSGGQSGGSPGTDDGDAGGGGAGGAGACSLSPGDFCDVWVANFSECSGVEGDPVTSHPLCLLSIQNADPCYLAKYAECIAECDTDYETCSRQAAAEANPDLVDLEAQASCSESGERCDEVYSGWLATCEEKLDTCGWFEQCYLALTLNDSFEDEIAACIADYTCEDINDCLDEYVAFDPGPQ